MLAVLQALDAELLVLDRERRIGEPRDRHEWRVIDSRWNKLFGKLEARAG